MTIEQEPQMPSRQSESNAIGSLPFNEAFIDYIEHLGNDMSVSMPLASYSSNLPWPSALSCRHTSVLSSAPAHYL